MKYLLFMIYWMIGRAFADYMLVDIDKSWMMVYGFFVGSVSFILSGLSEGW